MRWLALGLALALSVLSPSSGSAQDTYVPPLSAYVDLSGEGEDTLEPVEDDSATPLAERIRVNEFHYAELRDADDERDIGATLTLGLTVVEGFELAIPGLSEAFTIEVGAGAFSAEVTFREEASPVPEEDFPILATFSATTFPIALKLNPEFFRPVTSDTREPWEDPDGAARVSLRTAASISFKRTWDGESAWAFDDGTGGVPTLEVDTPFMLADTGVVLDVGAIGIDLSELESSGGDDPEWQGVILEQFGVWWTNGLDVPDAEVEDDGSGELEGTGVTGLEFTGFRIGTGGFSGDMCGDLSLAPIALAGMAFELDRLCVGFTRNALTSSEFVGTFAEFPFFESEVEVAMSLDLGGNFAIALSDPDPMDAEPLVKWTVPDVMEFYVHTMAFELREGLFLVSLDGELEPLFLDGDMQGTDAEGTPDADWRIPVQGLTITSEGDVSIEGGWITLPDKRYLDFHAFQVTLSAVGFGRNKDTTGQSWLGFTGGVALVDGLDASAEFERLQFLWPGTEGRAVDVKLEGVAVAFEQPGVLRFEGAVEWFDEAGGDGEVGSEGFAGALDIAVTAIGLDIGGRVVIGSADDPTSGDTFKFFYTDLESQFPAGVPVFSGFSIYGLSGLFALNMAPDIGAFDSPVDWFEAHRTATNVISGSPAPWEVSQGALALGAGVVVGTSDNGFTVNAKVALTISVPGPVVVLSGQANVLKTRSSLSDAGDVPLFVALAVFDPSSDVFLVNIGVFYELAKVVEVSGEAEAFFNLANPGDWHLYLGQKSPEERRITATVLDLVQASTYYMIEPTGLQFGSKLSIGDTWKFGPLKVRLEAWFSYDAGISWRPIQVTGAIDLGGAVELSAFGVSVGLSVSAELTLKTPQPYLIEGDFKVKLKLPWPLPDPSATVRLKWSKTGEQDPLDELVTDVTLHGRKGDWVVVPELDDLSGNTRGAADTSIRESALCSAGDSVPEAGSLDVVCDVPLVRLDSFVSARLDRSVNDPNDVGFGNPYSATESNRHVDHVGDESYQYDVTTYDLWYGARESNTITFDTEPTDLYASWTSIPSTASVEAHNNLDVISKNPYRYYTNATSLGYGEDAIDWTDWAAGHYGASYCLEFYGVYEGDNWQAYHYSEKYGAPLFGYLGEDAPNGPYLQELDCPLDLAWLEDEDFVLPPYSAFRFVVDGLADDPSGSPSHRKYRGAAYFYTEGPPLDLDPYVATTVPEFPWRPHYRGYDVSIRFDENYMNKLYRATEDQFLQVQVLDESENPVPGAIVGDAEVATYWDEAPDRILSDTEAAWYGVLEDMGALHIEDLAKDDLIYGRIDHEAAPRPGQGHVVRVWLEDPRLAGDGRLTDDDWLAAHDVGYIAPDRTRVVVYEYGFVASKYTSLTHLVSRFDELGGTTFVRDVDPGVSLVALAGAASPLDEDFAQPAVAVGNADSGPIGVFLRHLLPRTAPTELSDASFAAHVARTPGFEGDVQTLSGAQVEAIETRWAGARDAFGAVQDLLGLALEREPLPEDIEVSLLSTGSDNVGWLVELPEALDLSRVEIGAQTSASGAFRPVVVPNGSDTRLFVFRVTGGQVQPLADGDHELEFTFHRDLGPANPRVYHRDGADSESATLSFSVPDDRFVAENSP